MTFLLGRQAMLGQEPPIYLRSITATLLPCLASAHAMLLAPSPLPKTTMSYCSGFDELVLVAGRESELALFVRFIRGRSIPAYTTCLISSLLDFCLIFHHRPKDFSVAYVAL